MADDNVPGIDDVPRLGRWLHENRITPTGVPPRVRLIAGGRSNLTYLLEPGGRPRGWCCGDPRSAMCCRRRTT